MMLWYRTYHRWSHIASVLDFYLDFGGQNRGPKYFSGFRGRDLGHKRKLIVGVPTRYKSRKKLTSGANIVHVCELCGVFVMVDNKPMIWFAGK